MEKTDLALEISRAFIAERYPDRLDELDEFVRLSALGGREVSVAKGARKFSELDVLGAAIVPLVLSVVSEFLEHRRRAAARAKKAYGNEEIVLSIVQFAGAYLERKDARSAQGAPPD